MRRSACLNEPGNNVSSSPLVMLDYIYKENLLGCPKIRLAFSLLLAVPVTVVSEERRFSCLNMKLIKKKQKKHLLSTMSQERLTGLGKISIVHQICRKRDYSDIIVDFAAAKS
ncbi:hypothetical protein EOD39_9958 [Acipenser ruthenus]|uniref:HAT C-terminal dimerisation domain-containing protein n=1 Tax=Acipenser ruthenus TaxID=7906 RepID=A0A444TZC0_ACIRT|nr:hypothetical protein EOD39_9958 [Acipenser ruthenus]